MIVLAGERTDHVRVSSKRRSQSTRLDIPVPALNEVEDLKLVSDYDLPSSFRGKMGTEEMVDAQPELLQVETQSSKHKQLKSYMSVISAGDNSGLDSGRMTKTLRFAPVAVKKVLRWSFNDIIHMCVQLDNCQMSEQLFLEMHQIGLRPSSFTYDGFIKCVLAGKGVAHATKVIRAFGAEGMIDEMLRYLNVAENVLWNMDPYQKSDLYGIVLHALVKAKETDKAIRTFKIMRSCGLPANTAIYNVMIECCKLLPCFKSASTLVSLMLRDGCCPTVCTYTSLLKVLLAKDDFDGALDLLDLCITEGIQPDIGIFNTILSYANARGHIHIVECIVECIHRARIQPDESTLWYTFCAYVDQELYNTAIEALQVLSMRMISEDARVIKEKGAALEDLILSEEPDAELSIIKAFGATEECSVAALLNLRWCAMLGSTISWLPEDSLWARRLASSYDANRR